jgi:hypothetical protein
MAGGSTGVRRDRAIRRAGSPEEPAQVAQHRTIQILADWEAVGRVDPVGELVLDACGAAEDDQVLQHVVGVAERHPGPQHVGGGLHRQHVHGGVRHR